MQKVLYISRILLASFQKKLALIWVITFAVSFGLSMSIGIVQSQLNTQSYYLNEDMQSLAFLMDVETGFYSDTQNRRISTQSARTEISKFPGLCAIYEQTTVSISAKGWILHGYPAGLLNRLHLPTSEKGTEINASACENPIWLDYSLCEAYKIGDTITLDLYISENESFIREFTIAGFLNKDNVHYNFQSGSSSETYSADFVVKNADYVVCVTVSDAIFAGEEFDGNRSCGKFLLAETEENISEWKIIARRQGIGYISSMEDILRNDQTNIDLMSTPILTLCVIMVVLTLVGLVGTQLQLMNLYKQTAFSLMMTGMDWDEWKVSWLLICCIPLGISGLVGTSLGSAWKCVVMLENMCVFTWTGITISIALVLLSAIGIIPAVYRWNQVDINAFRRLNE